VSNRVCLGDMVEIVSLLFCNLCEMQMDSCPLHKL